MSIWLRALGGGLQGLGTSIMQADQEKREARGLALREAYLMKRLDATHAHQAGLQTERLDVTQSEGVATRETQQEIAETRIAAAAQQGQLDRQSRETMATERNEVIRDEGRANRGARAAGDRRLQAFTDRIRELEGRLGGQQRQDALFETFGEVYQSADPTTGETLPNYNLIRTAMGVLQDTGRPPWQIRLDAEEIEHSIRAHHSEFDEGLSALRELHYQLPAREVNRARRIFNRQTDLPGPGER